MNQKEVLQQAQKMFGKDRTLLREHMCAFTFEGRDYRQWRKRFRSIVTTPFNLSYGMFDDVVEALIQKRYDDIDWFWIGDLSWTVDILLNAGVKRGYDWDKHLARHCGGTARLLRIWINDILPAYTLDSFYMTYSSLQKYYEFGPIRKRLQEENDTIKRVKRLLKSLQYVYIPRKLASKHIKELVSDCNSEGNATVFECLFSDTTSFQREFKRFNEDALKDPTGKDINWNEYYDQYGNLQYREEYRYHASGNVECITTDANDCIMHVKVWRDIETRKHQEFSMDLLKMSKKLVRQHEKERQKKENP